MNKRLKYIFILILVMIIILSVFLFAVYWPNINVNSSSDFDSSYEEHSSTIDKHIVLIAKDLTDSAEYNSAMNFRAMFGSYSNINFSIYDSQNSLNKQQSYLKDILDSEVDVVILNPLDYQAALPIISDLSSSNISVITQGNYSISPHYTSIGYSAAYTGKLLANVSMEKIAHGNISLISKSSAYNDSSDIIKNFSSEINNDNINITSVHYTSNLAHSKLMSQIEQMTHSDAVVILDDYSFENIYNVLMSQGYSGYIFAVSQSKDQFAYVMENPNLTFIYQDTELFNEKLFDTLLSVFNNTQKKYHIEVQQFIINIDNIKEYIY